MIGCRRVVECLGPGRNGRADKSYRAVELLFVMYVALALWAIGLALQMAMLAQ